LFVSAKQARAKERIHRLYTGHTSTHLASVEWLCKNYA